MADLIDRDALMKKICGNECGSVCDEECENALCNFYDYIMDAPAVNRWIPCDKRMPEINAEVLVTLYKPELSGYFRKIGRFLGDKWLISNLYSSGMENVVAWMPLPDAYKPPETEVKR